MDEIVNKVAQSGLVTIDLQDWRPEGARAVVDIKERLWEGIALKEKDFRTWVSEWDWTAYAGQHVAVTCSADAIIPSWAYMLLSSALTPHAKTIVFGDADALESVLFKSKIDSVELAEYTDARVIVKGCGQGVPTSAYLYLTHKLQPVVKSLMFGEACSTVPVYKAPKKVV
jgi:S-adenosylmethionine/arginine decarboxylase-like enzyme